MNEQLLTFETAVLAKQKGFTACTEEYYSLITKELHFGLSPICHVDEEIVATYTQSLLQKWLREVHDIHIVIRRIYPHSYMDDYSTIEYNPFVYLSHNENNHVGDTLGDEYDKYEDALERGLQVALKYI